MSKHTPGPWEISDRHPIRACVHVTAALGDIASLYGAPGDPDTQDAEGIYRGDPIRMANARLIAAAPNMLAVLEDALEYIAEDEDVCDGNDGFQVPNRAMQLAQSLRAVLIKAKGE